MNRELLMLVEAISREKNVEADVVFGAVGSLLRHFEPDGEGGFKLDVKLRMEPGETRVPKCPIP